ncbi:hypothetical protein HPB49_015575 [Dermacentor silvarum]|uniref:Uncharacterized protein n=1 Tax=Dermacentor silvarum TaxID=543639 RepID=A0ACB8CXV5_DERSI|nr:hypothetical protein HPB49_015575 [Dermacentor silvarum]
MFSGSVLLPGGDATADCVLRTSDGGAFRAHRAYLCTVSPYFAAVFREQFGSPRDVVVGGVSAAVLDALLTFQYTDQLCVSPQNVLEVLQAADMFLLDEARKQCLLLLLKTMGTQNCLSLAALTRQYYCPNFTDAVFTFVRENFDEVWRLSEEFVDTPAWLMYQLLSSPELNADREEDVLHAIARWFSAVSSPEEANRTELLELLQCVRIGRFSKDALAQFRNRWPSLFDSAEFQEAIIQALTLGPCMCSPNKLMRALTEPENPPEPTPPANAAPNLAVAAAAAINEAGNLFLAMQAQNAALSTSRSCVNRLMDRSDFPRRMCVNVTATDMDGVKLVSSAYCVYGGKSA